jgi:hypothetical protein
MVGRIKGGASFNYQTSHRELLKSAPPCRASLSATVGEEPKAQEKKLGGGNCSHTTNILQAAQSNTDKNQAGDRCSQVSAQSQKGRRNLASAARGWDLARPVTLMEKWSTQSLTTTAEHHIASAPRDLSMSANYGLNTCCYEGQHVVSIAPATSLGVARPYALRFALPLGCVGLPAPTNTPAIRYTICLGRNGGPPRPTLNPPSLYNYNCTHILHGGHASSGCLGDKAEASGIGSICSICST